MAEVAHAGKHHRDVVFIRGFDDLAVADGATGLNHRGYPGFGYCFETISEGDKAI